MAASRTGHVLAFQSFEEPRVKLNFEAKPVSSGWLGGVIFRVDCSHPCPANISATPHPADLVVRSLDHQRLV